MFSFIFNYRSDFEFRREPEKSAPLLKTSTQLQWTSAHECGCSGPGHGPKERAQSQQGQDKILFLSIYSERERETKA